VSVRVHWYAMSKQSGHEWPRPYEENLVEQERQAHPGALVLPRARVSWKLLATSSNVS